MPLSAPAGEPLTLLEKLAAIIPRPRINLVLYHGVLAPHSGWRARLHDVEDVDDADGLAGFHEMHAHIGEMGILQDERAELLGIDHEPVIG